MIKKCWAVKNGSLLSISIESENVNLPISVRQILFPNPCQAGQEQRHTTNIGLFDEDDIDALAILLDKYRTPNSY